MGGYLWGIGLALLAAVGVIVMANAVGDGGSDLRGFWRDLRNGLRRRRDEDAVADDEVAEPVDVPFEQLFAEASQPDDGYLQLDELAEMLERTGERAGRLLPGQAREHRPAAVPRPRAGSRHPRVPGAARTAARRSGHVPATTAAGGPPASPASPSQPQPPQPRDG
ncbi:hypothetical protein [Cellulomonas hominis]|uniref:hypothetical protein n=1 Tax=Cellulomonas hominis TaxID=156981 RepID=UPI001B942B7C|nr:hypothetical protein [Cellulomonas hominis]VTR77089.1 hypothetical protein CHMI_01857 [Cellulomonas hominis]